MLTRYGQGLGEDTDVYKRMKAQGFIIPGEVWTDFLIPRPQTAYWSELNKGIFQGRVEVVVDGRFRAGVLTCSKGKTDVSGKRRVGAVMLIPLYVTKAIYEGQRATPIGSAW